RVTLVWSNSAGGIWQATKRFQISVYSFSSSLDNFEAAPWGVNFASVGRMASWASWALLFDELKKFGFSGRDLSPNALLINPRTIVSASPDKCVESVRM